MASKYQITRAADLEALADFHELIDRACGEQPAVDRTTCYELKLAVEEACANVVTHGYAGMNPGSIVLQLAFDPGQVRVTLTDFGHAFEPCEPDAPDLEAALEEGLSQGFGLYIIYQTMDDIQYHTAQDGNHLVFTKRLPAGRKA